MEAGSDVVNETRFIRVKGGICGDEMIGGRGTLLDCVSEYGVEGYDGAPSGRCIAKADMAET